MNAHHLTWLIVGALLVAGTAPAAAGSASCTASLARLGNDSCSTVSVAASSSGHFVHIAITGDADWELVETMTGVVVARGTTGPLGLDRTVFGLFGRYQLRLGANAAHGTISNN